MYQANYSNALAVEPARQTLGELFLGLSFPEHWVNICTPSVADTAIIYSFQSFFKIPTCA
jgi:hypothetical protein